MQIQAKTCKNRASQQKIGPSYFDRVLVMWWAESTPLAYIGLTILAKWYPLHPLTPTGLQVTRNRGAKSRYTKKSAQKRNRVAAAAA